MLKNYLKTAFRNIRRQPVYAGVNILGLGVGLACCLWILIFVQHEFGVNRHLGQVDSIYRLNSVWHEQGDAVRFLSFAPMGHAMEQEFAAVTRAFHYTAIDADVKAGNTPFRAPVIIAGPELFTLFDSKPSSIDPSQSLSNPGSVVLTEKEAIRLFGSTDVLGENLFFSMWDGEGQKPFEVTGIIENPPFNSVSFIGQQENGVFVPFANANDFFAGADFDGDWGIYNTVTYVALNDVSEAEIVEQQLPAMLESNLPDALQGSVSIQLEPLKDVYLNDFGGGARRLTRLLLVLALLILGIACFNYINISTALAVSRAQEVGMRKVLGASRQQLVRQYLGESILVCALGMGVALVLAWTGIEPFSELVERVLAFDFGAPRFWLMVTALVAVVGVLGGLYPAFYLSTVQPAKSLKALVNTGRKANGMRRGLVVVQFVIAIGLFICAAVVNQQARHIASQDVGFNKDQVLAISSLPREWTAEGVQKLEVIKQAIGRVPGVEKTSIAWGPPGPRYTGISWDFESTATEGNSIAIPVSQVDGDFLETMGLELVAGMFFDPQQADADNVVVLNETAVARLGLEAPVGEFVDVAGTPFRVTGVVKDYYTAGLEQPLGPVGLVDVRQNPLYRELLIRFPGKDTEALLTAVREQWAGVYPDVAFDYYFVDQQWDDLHKWIWRTQTIAGLATLLSIFVACLGLFGVVSISVKQRTREIGIRKVIGASLPAVLRLLSIDFLKLVALAYLIAIPLAWITMQTWLDGFANRISMGWPVFLLAGVIMLVVAGITAGSQALRAALMNPVKAIRND